MGEVTEVGWHEPSTNLGGDVVLKGRERGGGRLSSGSSLPAYSSPSQVGGEGRSHSPPCGKGLASPTWRGRGQVLPSSP